MVPDSLIDQALSASSESAQWDFKQSFDPKMECDWLELLKDIVAMANSGGGVIAFGMLDNGFPVGCSVEEILAIDPATITDKAFKYTGIHIDHFRLVRCKKNEIDLCALVIGPAEFLLVFQRVGTFSTGDGKQKTAFGQGTIYFRHGAKSEPAVTADIRTLLERRAEDLRANLMRNLKAVLDAPPDSMFAVLPSVVRLSTSPDAQPVRITNEQAAQLLQAPLVDQTHPFRQKEALCEINRRLESARHLNTHDLLCIRRAHSIQRDLKYCYNMNWNSPRYSLAFVEWVVEKVTNDPLFVQQCRDNYTEKKALRSDSDDGSPQAT